ncbi:beta-hexosaminidase, partial [Methylopila musalis]
MPARAFVSGCSGLALTDDERAFFRDAEPWGLILFGRNIASHDQIRALVSDFREAVGRDDAPVLIDQEGGRVRRLRPPLALDHPPARAYGALHALDPAAGL